MALTQNREVVISSPLGPDDLLFHSMQGREELGRTFQYDLVALSNDRNLDGDQLLGKEASVALRTSEGERHFAGYVTEFAFDGMAVVGDREMARYHLTLRPWLHFLSLASDYRIYQDKSALDIILDIFGKHSVARYANKVTESPTKRVFCVQYGESDFHFVSRLMEEEGIYYYFEHKEKQHTLVLADAYSSHSPAPGYDEIGFEGLNDNVDREGVHRWRVTHAVRSTAYNVNSFDFEVPKKNLKGKSQVQPSHSGPSALERHDFAGTYVEPNAAERLARVRREELQARAAVAVGEGDVRGVAPGYLVKLQNHPRGNENQEYLVIAADYTAHAAEYRSGGSNEPTFGTSFECIASRHPFRTASTTPRPIVPGPQTAIVVGPSGEEIWTDEHGRVRVQFHWDNYGQKDENSSCWVRVSQAWAGKGFGAAAIPRIGQEVVVEFIDGDPDRPIVTGRVYNGDNRYPEKLPDKQNLTTLKSHSTKQGGAANYNELVFDDTKDEELIRLHAEKNFDTTVENDRTVKIGFDKKDPGDDTLEVYNDQNVTIDQGDQTITIKTGNRTISVDKGDLAETVSKGDRTVKVDQGNDTLTISQGNGTIKASVGKLMFEAAQEIQLKVGPSKIIIKPDGITISSPQVKLDATGMLQAKSGGISKLEGAMVQVKGSAMLKAQGGVTMIG